MPERDSRLEGPGVYGIDPEGNSQPIHLYQEGDYALEDIVEYFQIGRLEPDARSGATVLVLTGREMRELKVMADAYSFDYEAGFIEMCLELYRFSTAHPADTFRFRDCPE